MIDEDWSGFLPAFTEAVRPGDARGRHGRRMLSVALAGLLAIIVSALMYGAFGGSAAASPASAATAPWTAVAGPTCSSTSTGFTAVGYSATAPSAKETGWSTSPSGGYPSAGCTGGFLSLPLSGQPSAYDSTRSALWTFALGPQQAGESCRLSTYVPDQTSIALVGGDPAYYFYYGSDYTPGSAAKPQGGYEVNQVANLGAWVSGPALKVTAGTVTVQLVDAGVDQASATSNAHAAVAQVRLTCPAG